VSAEQPDPPSTPNGRHQQSGHGVASSSVNGLARWVSILGHPFVMVGVMVVGAALRFGTAVDAARAVLLVAALALAPIAVLMIRQVRRGSWGNVDASNSSERPALYGVGIVALAVLIAYALAFRPGSFLVRGGIGVLGMLIGCALATRWIKVSLHMAFGALAAATLLFLGSVAGWFVLALLPVLAWSRLALGRHSAPELVGGLLAGLASAYGIHRL
jgi:hypothetical protein